MISLKRSNNIFYDKRVILDYLESDSFELGSKIKHVDWLELRITGEENEEKFEEFLDAFFSLLKKQFSIYVFCYERSVKLKNRLRSYGKLFFEFRKERIIGNEYLIEKELDTDEHHSLFAGVIQIDEIENEIILNEIIANCFRFGYAESIDNQLVRVNKLKKLIEQIDFKLLREGKLIELDYLTLLNRLVTPTSMIFSYQFDGKDDLVFTVYSGNQIFNQVEEVVLESLPEDIELHEEKANSKELDRLIDSYFKDWRPV